jgi:hypothetical protein
MNDSIENYGSTKDISVEWTGSYPNLCSGKWIITIDGNEIIDNSKEQGNYDSALLSNMGTEGTYQSWHFDDNYSEVFEDYDAGYHFEEWYNSKSGKFLKKTIDNNTREMSKADMNYLFAELQKKDWRSNSCGGCI